MKDGKGIPSEWSYEAEVPPFRSDKQTSELRTRDEGHFTLTNEQSIKERRQSPWKPWAKTDKDCSAVERSQAQGLVTLLWASLRS